ncbi:MAG: hypothetical protein SVZ03_11895 [Spirochaetota bacterium]|nr:hypothetical protein [Spirochaetota bacterium]
MLKRKQYLLDKRFQLKTTFSIIGVSSIIVAILIIVIVSSITENNNKLANIIIIQENVVESLLTYSQTNQSSVKRLAFKNVANNHYTNITTIKKIINHNNRLLIIIIIIGVLQSIVLFFFMIRKTHQISGPLFVLSRHIKDIINGSHPTIRPLRKNDELKDLYELFIKMVETMKEKEKDPTDDS